MIDLSAVDAPLLEEVWWAQVAYWIQKDVVEAIATVNEAAAEAARTRGEETWVGNMPVKDVISIRVSGEYISRDSEDEKLGDEPVGFEPATPPGTPSSEHPENGAQELSPNPWGVIVSPPTRRDNPRTDGLTVPGRSFLSIVGIGHTQ